MEAKQPGLFAVVAAEGLGTFMLVLFGCGAVHAAVLSGAQTGLWQVAIIWGISIMLACYVVGGVSGAHINPAITLGLAAWGKFPVGRMLPYIAAQMAGAFVAAAALFGAWSPLIEAKEKQLGVERGKVDSVMTAMCYGEYFPNPGVIDNLRDPDAPKDAPWKGDLGFDSVAKVLERYKSGNRFETFLPYVPHGVAFAIEVVGTLILALVVCATTDDRNRGGPAHKFAPVFIGLTVAALVSIIAPLTQACFNPARDWGPRILAYLAGWGEAAIPGPNGIGCVTVYILAPIVGAVLGVGLYERGVRSWLAATS
ncbi:MAG: aquaporin [Planctomycetota bacterium]|nr:MAG: aquaporin [Planctomycetota bacterium]